MTARTALGRHAALLLLCGLAACQQGATVTSAGPDGGCAMPLAVCGAHCVDATRDPANCGRCGNACAPGKSCRGGVCLDVCEGVKNACDGACVDLDTDPAHCGSCAVACASGEACVQGACAIGCAQGQSHCAGRCVDLQKDPANCGACGLLCGADPCLAGVCQGCLSLSPPIAYGVGSPDPSAIITGDLDGDGSNDLIVTNWLSDSISVLSNQGKGVFNAPPVQYPTHREPASLAMGDLDGDGAPEVAVSCLAGTSVDVFFNKGKGLLGPAVSVSDEYVSEKPVIVRWGYSSSIATGDLQAPKGPADGKLDLVVLVSGTLTVLTNDGMGRFLAGRDADVANAGNPDVNGTVGHGQAFAIGDFNGDGIQDVGECFTEEDFVALNERRWPVAQQYGYWPVGRNPNSIVAGDLNGDGATDFVTANTNSGDLTVRLNIAGSGGVFEGPVGYGVGTAPQSVQVADITGDGKPDLIALIPSANMVAILPNIGGGRFGAAVRFAVGPNPISVAAGDFSGDGKLDLAVANSAKGSYVSVLINQSTCK